MIHNDHEFVDTSLAYRIIMSRRQLINDEDYLRGDIDNLYGFEFAASICIRLSNQMLEYLDKQLVIFKAFKER